MYKSSLSTFNFHIVSLCSQIFSYQFNNETETYKVKTSLRRTTFPPKKLLTLFQKFMKLYDCTCTLIAYHFRSQYKNMTSVRKGKPHHLLKTFFTEVCLTPSCFNRGSLLGESRGEVQNTARLKKICKRSLVSMKH